MPAARTSQSRAFTLVELLVVISIIVILASLLIAALGGARNSARSAYTKSIITTVQTGFQQFRADKGRLPGVFSQRDFASSSNNSGLTQMENALLELSYDFDRYQDAGAPPNENEQGFFEIDAGVIGSESFQVFGSLVGSPDNLNAYLDIGDRLAPAAEYTPPSVTGGGTDGTWSSTRQFAIDSSGNNQTLGMPDILDAWDNPIMLWQRNRASADRAALFAIDFDPSGPDQPGGEKFFYRSNAGYLASASQALGQQRSLLRTEDVNDAGSAPDADQFPLLRTMDVLLGHPAFPSADEADRPAHVPAPGITRFPARELSDVIFHSAGRNGTFVERVDPGVSDDPDSGTDQLLYNFEAWGNTEQATGAALEGLDDLIQAGG